MIFLSLHAGPKLGDYISTREEMNQRARDVFQWVADGKLDVRVDKVFSLQDAKEGHAYIEAGKTQGKILFRI
jgi:NADPH2:quinone reductase